MSTLEIMVERTASIDGRVEVVGQLVSLGAALREHTRLRMLWVRFRGEHLELNAATLGLVLAQGSWLRGARAEQPPHVLPIVASPKGPSEVGILRVARWPDETSRATPGVTLSASLADDVFDTSAPALQSLLERCIAAVSADHAVVGPGDWVRELGAGWATFARRLRRDALPAGAAVVAARDGAIVLAHAEAPASESASARAAITRVRDAMQPEPTAAQQPKPVLAGPPPAPRESPVPPSPPPTYLAAAASPARPPPRPAAADLARTAPAPDVALGPALPFVVGACSAPPAPAPASAHRPASPRAALTGTSLAIDMHAAPALPFESSVAGVPAPAPSTLASTAPVVELPNGPTLPFAERGGEGSLPSYMNMTLEQYALFRAHLVLHGEDDAETLKAFGVGSASAKEALQARFVWLFKQAPAAQAAFVELVRKLSTQLRAQPLQR